MTSIGFGQLLTLATRLLVGAYPRWPGGRPLTPAQRIYFANHSSHLDTLALWAALPPDLRAAARPVAAKDYWGGGGLKTFIAVHGLNAVLIERKREERAGDPLAPLIDALRQGDSLILFPEGTRHAERLPGPFKSGLYKLALQFPEVELTPVYLENLHRSLPRGRHIPVPLSCTVRFGLPLPKVAGEAREEFLRRARQAVVDLSA